MNNILIGGAAGDGIDTIAAVIEKAVQRSGLHVFTSRDFMSRIRGGHNFTQIRFSPRPVHCHRDTLDCLVALNPETEAIHADRLVTGGVILSDTSSNSSHRHAVSIDMHGTAKELGNPKSSGSVAAGAALKLFGVRLETAQEAMRATMRENILDDNLKALAAGYEAVESQRAPTEAEPHGRILVTGAEAMSLGALAAGLQFYSAYPMSPSTTIMSFLSAHSKETGVVVEQAEDEIAAANMALGASFAGALSMTGTSGGGFSLMVEALGLSGIAEIPVVIANVQRPGPATGLPTRTEQSDLKFVISASQGEFPRMVIALRHHADAFYQTARAFALAERYQIPVILLSDQYLADSSATIPPFDVSHAAQPPARDSEPIEDPADYLRYRLTGSGISPLRIPGKSETLVAADSDEHDERGHITESAEVRRRMVDKRMEKMKGLAKEVLEPEFMGVDSCDTLLLGFGSTYGPIKEAVSRLNAADPGRYGALVFGDIYPMPLGEVTRRAKTAKKIITVEQNATGQLAGLLREHTGIVCSSHILKYDGRQISGKEIAEQLERSAQ